MTNDDNTVDEDIAAALTNAFPEREIEEVLPAGPSWNDLNETVRVEFVNGQLVFLKIAADGDLESLGNVLLSTTSVHTVM